ncbi:MULTISPECIES: saccharopine dehydrogenase NADP-binding domain-containing protein [Streptosporangium]|uniref:Saccharopine dehydrogenase NADP binding domain-containing protein n=1 Tax=Streptosporangium brasiliense TaxID=47480 RepID=A0ABT9RPB0_9ACTN|nr:saccharopine dehydrogenase NADP-binding domain-containing protein [Streptosporangium brasiliense]MDP9870190.1 hypothetical protein [Streptosporangium brasiliense]
MSGDRRAPVVGVLGCYGAVGGAVVRRLRGAGAGPLRLGGRDLGRVRALAAARTGADAAVAVDIRDAAALAAFCEGCHVVVNCAGPSSRVLDTVARAALAAGAHYVDVAGDAAVRDRLSAGSAARPDRDQAGRERGGWERAGRVVILSAGMMPGLSALLPRHLAGQGFDRVDRLTAHVGGVDRFTPAAALDYVASLSGGYATPLAVWRGHQVIPGASRPRHGVEVPHFPGRVNAYPYLSAEAERLARSLGIAEVEWSSVFDGELTLAALARLPELDPDAAADELVRASRLESLGRTPYFQMVFEMAGETGGRPVTRTLLARAADSYELSAAAAVPAVGAVLRGLVRPGLHEAADVLDAGAVFQALLDDPAVTRLEIVDGAARAAEMEMEEGVL